MSASQPEVDESTDLFMSTIEALVGEVNRQRLIAFSNNERLCQHLEEMHRKNEELQLELEKRTESQKLEIAERQNSIGDLEFRYNGLLAENSELQGKMKILAGVVVDLEKKAAESKKTEENLLFENQELKSDLTNKKDEIKTLTAQAKALSSRIQAKEALVSDLTNKRINLEKANGDLVSQLSTAQGKLSLIEPNYNHVSQQLQALQTNHAAQIFKYQTVEEQCQKQQIELNHYKSHNMVVEVFELHRILENVRALIISTGNQLSTKRNSEKRASARCKIEEMKSEYEKIEENLESLGVDITQADFTDLINTYTDIHEEIDAKFKEGVDRVLSIDREALLIWQALKDVMYKIMDIVKSSSAKHMKEMGHLANISLAEELETEEQLFEKAKNVYNQIKAYAQSMQGK